MRYLILSTALLSSLLVSVGYCSAGDKTASEKFGASPHTETGDCTICHLYSAETLRSWFVFGSTKKLLNGNLNEVCRNCHGSGFGHGVGKKTKVNHANLPLNHDGEITCATTCHDMHVRTEDQKQKYFHLRRPFDSLCISCHDT
ncbi:MAG: cytochrome C [Geobacter sp.]|nr:cytochrome C [Geobacter sp.]